MIVNARIKRAFTTKSQEADLCNQQYLYFMNGCYPSQALRVLDFGIIPGRLSYLGFPQKQRSLFFDVWWTCGKGHHGIEVPIAIGIGYFWPSNLSRPSAAKA